LSQNIDATRGVFGDVNDISSVFKRTQSKHIYCTMRMET